MKKLNWALEKRSKKEPPKFYLLILFNEKQLTNETMLFESPIEAKEYIERGLLQECTAYLVDLRQTHRPYIKLS